MCGERCLSEGQSAIFLGQVKQLFQGMESLMKGKVENARNSCLEVSLQPYW